MKHASGPLEKWKESRALLYLRAPFRATYAKTLRLLEYELDQISATQIFIEAGFASAQIRNDGWPRGKARPSHPGVILYFKTKKNGAMRFPCGTYDDFEDNLRAIALTLENLRAVDRYGVTMGHEQYQGFKALPPSATEHSGWSLDEAAIWLAARTTWATGSKQMLTDYEAYRRAYREAAQTMHPDVGGSADLFHALQSVAALLNAHHGR